MIPYLYHLEKMVRNVFWACSDGWFPVSRIFYVRTCVKFTFANKIMAMHERSLVSVKVEPRSTSRLSSALFILVFILFTWLKFKCVNVHSQKRVSGNQPWVQLCANISLFRSRSDRLISKFCLKILSGWSQFVWSHCKHSFTHGPKVHKSQVLVIPLKRIFLESKGS